MKFLLTVFIFMIVPLIICLALIYAVAPLFMQRLLPKRNVSDKDVYSYQTSWEEAA